MEITKEQLKAIMPNVTAARIETYLPLLNKYMAEFEINTRLRVCHYLAQIAHESGELRYTEELGKKAYFDKYDTGTLAKQLGNTQAKDGDGYKYRGRGLIQLTGHSNYEDYKKYCGFDVVKDPDLLAKPLGATRSSCWFWKTRGLNELADADDIIKITEKINGKAKLGLEARKTYYQRAKLAIKQEAV